MAEPNLGPTSAAKRARDFRWIFPALAVIMVVLDQLIKAWARHTFSGNLAALGGWPAPGTFELTLTYNRGIAFGFLQGQGVLLTPIALIMAGLAAWYSWKTPRGHAFVHVAMGLLAAGALGNLYDRLAFGKVTDIFYFRAINFPVFNLADACITVAAIMLMVVWGMEAARDIAGPAEAPVPESTADDDQGDAAPKATDASPAEAQPPTAND